jgi:hypothetical protein
MLLTSTSSLHHSVVPPMARGECCRPLPLGLLLSVVAPDFGGLSLLGRCRRGTAPGLPLDVATCTRHGCPSQGATGQNSSTENNLEGCLIILSIAYNAIYNLQPSPQYLWGSYSQQQRDHHYPWIEKNKSWNWASTSNMIIRNQKRIAAYITRWIQVEFSHWRSCWSY